jgi:hypothetical protein
MLLHSRKQRKQQHPIMNLTPCILAVLISAAALNPAQADDFAARCADRASIERIYHTHRLGTKQFEQAMPRALLGQIVRQDQHKEAVLKKVYGMEITPAMVAAEVERINTTTRAPEVLAEIKTALGDDAARFATAMARPILVERELRRRFDNDGKLHAAQRREADLARESLLAKKPVKEMRDVTWHLTPRPAEDKPAPPAAATTPTKANAKSSAYTNEATAQLSQALNPPDKSTPGKEKLYFEELEPELQKVLGVQLQKPGDVSAVVEMPGGFLVFLAKEKNAETLSAASVTISKRSYEEWLVREPGGTSPGPRR